MEQHVPKVAMLQRSRALYLLAFLSYNQTECQYHRTNELASRALLEIVYFVPKNTKRPKCSSMSSPKQASTWALWVRLAFSRDAESHPQGVHWMLWLLQVNIPKMLGLMTSFVGPLGSGTWDVILSPK